MLRKHRQPVKYGRRRRHRQHQDGVSGEVIINNAQAIENGSGEVVDFAFAGTNSVTVSGTSEIFMAHGLSGVDRITGFDTATDPLYLSAAQFGSSVSAFLQNEVLQFNGATVIADPNNQANQLVLVGVNPASLVSSNLHLV